MGVESENMEKRRVQCSRIREQKQRLSDVSHSLFEKRQRNRELSVMESKAMRSHVEGINHHTIEENRTRAERVRSEKERRKEKLKRYEVLFLLYCSNSS